MNAWKAACFCLSRFLKILTQAMEPTECKNDITFASFLFTVTKIITIINNKEIITGTYFFIHFFSYSMEIVPVVPFSVFWFDL